MLSDTPMKVGYVVKRYPRFSETFIVNEVLAHERAGLEVEVFALGFPAEERFQGSISLVRGGVTYLMADRLKAEELWQTVHAASRALPGLWSALANAGDEDVRYVHQAVRLARAVRERGITHLHAHFATSATTVASLAARMAGVPYTLTAHAKDIFHESVRPEELRRKLSDAAACVTVSDYNLDYLRAQYGPAAARVRRIYNGLDLSGFPYASPQERAPRVLALGRLVEKKGFSYLVDACALLAERGVPFTCEIIGEGEEEAPLRDRIARFGLEEKVRMPGALPQHDVIRHLREAAVFAAPCVVGADGNRDGLPTVLLEAMALGTPCVSTDVTGIPEVLRPEETGLMVPQHDPEALAEALTRLLADGGLRQRLAEQARRLIEEEFDVHRNASRIRQVFRSPVPARAPAFEEAA